MRALTLIVLLLLSSFTTAQVPTNAHRYRGDLTRNARLVWGLDAPVAVFAAQIHQESTWRADAVSKTGARGMAQFMPATERWIVEIYPDLQNTCATAEAVAGGVDCPPPGATNPVWAIRALIKYDRWLWQRLPIGDDAERMWATLRSYNGGLGHWQAEARNATNPTRVEIDAACGSARRSIKHCAENLSYPRRIMIDLQPRYQHWGGAMEVRP